MIFNLLSTFYPLPANLLPFYGSGRLGGNIIHDPIYSGDFVGNPHRDSFKKRVRKMYPIGSEELCRLYGAENDGSAVGARVSLHTNRANIGECTEVKKVGVFDQACFSHLLGDDSISMTQYVEFLLRRLPDDAHGKARTGERHAVGDCFREFHFVAHFPRFVLIQIPQGFNKCEAESLRQAADIVMRLNNGGVCASRTKPRTHDISVERSLHQELDASDFAGFALKNADEQVSDGLSLLFRLCNARKGCQKLFLRIHNFKIQPERPAEILSDMRNLPRPHESRVHKNAGKSPANSAIHQCRGD